jgi:hypothetical protein
MFVEVPQGTGVMTFSYFKHSSSEFIHTSTGAKQKIPTKTVMAHYCHISLQSEQQVVSHLHPQRMSTGQQYDGIQKFQDMTV